MARKMILPLFLLLFVSSLCAELPIVYLSWVGDPTSTMVVRWHTSTDYSTPSTVVYHAEGKTKWRSQEGSCRVISGTRVEVHSVELSGLSPGTTYVFRVGEDKKEMRFRTLPCSFSKDRPLNVVVGGDAYSSLWLFRKMNRQIAKKDPDFVVVAGDVAYTYRSGVVAFLGKIGRVKRWQTFLREWKREMVGKEGRLIPMMVVIGNHDLKGPRGGTFFDLFPFPEPEKAYRMFDIGTKVSLALLDTGHRDKIEGEQAKWLEEALKAREAVPWKMAIYHVAAYPSVYPYEGKTPLRIRMHWVPLFDDYGLLAAFEHHNHAFKRTKFLKEGKEDPSGVLYLGDGAWGVSPRAVEKQWYLEKAAKVNGCWQMLLSEEECLFEAFGNEGELLDRVVRKKHPLKMMAHSAEPS